MRTMKMISEKLLRVARVGMLLCGLLLFLESSPRLFSQTSTGSLSGIVRDESGAVITSAKITLTDIETNVGRTTESNTLGYYSFPLLPPAVYRLEADRPGFKHFVRQSVKLDVGQATAIDVALQIGSASETVTVTDAPPPLDTESSSLGQVIDNKRLVDLPINGRNSYGFAALVPGVRASAMFQQVAYASYNDQFVSIRRTGSHPQTL
jgi:hypothetical protein